MSTAGEQAISKALALMKKRSPSQGDVERVDKDLRNALSDIDRFWVRWSAFRDEKRTSRQGAAKG